MSFYPNRLRPYEPFMPRARYYLNTSFVGMLARLRCSCGREWTRCWNPYELHTGKHTSTLPCRSCGRMAVEVSREWRNDNPDLEHMKRHIRMKGQFTRQFEDTP